MPERGIKPFKCENGKNYIFPEEHCVFCKYCTDIFWDYTNGPYMFICDVDGGKYTTCGKFEEEEDD